MRSRSFSSDVPPRPLLSGLERRVLAGLARGLSERELAAELGYSYPYIREVAARAAERLGAPNRVAAVYRAAKAGLI